ncbi:MAG TPA: hypothetical protein VLD63_00030 [Anaerolineales bacterium]|nr:hypothetical protein [Anaerolineales bacterium]
MEVLHDRLADSLLLFMVAAGAWNLVAALRRRGIASETWGILAVGELLALVQGVLGLLLYVGGARPARAVHILYGVVAVLTLPAYYAISHGRDDRRASWAYTWLCLFLAGISVRGITTGA